MVVWASSCSRAPRANAKQSRFAFRVRVRVRVRASAGTPVGCQIKGDPMSNAVAGRRPRGQVSEREIFRVRDLPVRGSSLGNGRHGAPL